LTCPSTFGSHSPAIKRWLGLDFGLRRCGFALSDPGQSLASPLCVLETEPRASLPRRLAAELARKGSAPLELAGLVCGLPLSERGKETDMSARARGAAAELAAQLAALAGEGAGLPIEFIDERFSSREMNARGAELGIGSRERRSRIDAWAATSILQGFLDQRRTGVLPD
jgi:putative Holliday junction resolvase